MAIAGGKKRGSVCGSLSTHWVGSSDALWRAWAMGIVLLMTMTAVPGCRQGSSGGAVSDSSSATSVGGASTEDGDELAELTGAVVIDGSSTVFPLMEVAAHEFEKKYPKVKITIAFSGTGGGFKRFVQGETDFSNASRPIKWEEFQQAHANGVAFVELPVAIDGLTIVVHPSNTWADQLTVEQLRLIYLEGGVKRWSEVKAGWPDLPLKIFSPGTDSGTYDYFKEVILGSGGGAMRADMSLSEDDNVLVTGVAGDANAIGYFGASYYFENRDRLRAVPIVNPRTGMAVAPSPDTIRAGDYEPFSRPLLVYINARSLRRPEVRKFAEFLCQQAGSFAQQVQYVPLPDVVYQAAQEHLKRRTTGTHFWNADGTARHGSLEELYRQQPLSPSSPM